MRKKRNKNVLLIGGFNKAKFMAASLLDKGYKVTIVNNNYEDCVKLAEIHGLIVIHGDGTKPYILDEANASECDIMIALTSKDTDNLVACQLCKKKFNVSKTVSLVSDPKKIDFFYQMGVDRVVCAVSALASIIQHQAFIEDMTNLIPVGAGRSHIMEIQVPSDSSVIGKKLWEITFPKETIVACILRSDITVIPRGDTKILAGDTLVVVTKSGQEFKTIQMLTGRR